MPFLHATCASANRARSRPKSFVSARRSAFRVTASTPPARTTPRTPPLRASTQGRAFRACGRPARHQGIFTRHLSNPPSLALKTRPERPEASAVGALPPSKWRPRRSERASESPAETAPGGAAVSVCLSLALPPGHGRVDPPSHGTHVRFRCRIRPPLSSLAGMTAQCRAPVFGPTEWSQEQPDQAPKGKC